MKKRFLCLSLIFAMTAAQVMPVAAARKDEVQAEKAETQSKLAQAESKADDLEAKKNALLNEIDSIDKSLVQTIAQIDILKGEISDKEDAITETKEKLEEKRRSNAVSFSLPFNSGFGKTFFLGDIITVVIPEYNEKVTARITGFVRTINNNTDTTNVEIGVPIIRRLRE